VEHFTGQRPEPFVIQLPVCVTTLDEALAVAARVARLVRDEHGVLATSACVQADTEELAHRVYCDYQWPDGRRCPKRHGHQGGCG
jgi:hypothetical protein